MTTMKVFHWFWAWDDDKEEAWLRKMAQKGWHFQSASPPGNYTFESGQPRDYVFRLDFFRDDKEKPNYLQLFLDAGWDYMGEMNNWQYFRKEVVDGVAPEIFSDNESKAKKYQRLLFILVALLPLYVNAINLVNKRSGAAFEIFTFLMFLFIILYGYAIVRLFTRVNQLKKRL